MYKFVIILLMLFIFSSQVQCANIVYPKKTEVTINSPHTFFIGNEPSNKLKINNENVNLYKTGAFKHAVDLNYGENIFNIDNGFETKIYKIYRETLPQNTSDIKDLKKLIADENPAYEKEVKEAALKGNLKVTVDAGHGGKENGAIGCLGEKEKDINLKIAIKLRDQLKNAGYQVFMTREDDSFVGLRDRVEYANNNDSHVFISIHANALPDSLARKEIRGSEVYYLYPQAEKLAQSVLKSLNQECNIEARGIYQRNFAVIRNPKAISILVEIAYIIDPQDEEKLIDNNFQDKAAEAILNGLENYLRNDI